MKPGPANEITIEGQIVRFGLDGVGIVDVEGCETFTYFTPKNIVGYRSETVKELRLPRHGPWIAGRRVRINGSRTILGDIIVSTIELLKS